VPENQLRNNPDSIFDQIARTPVEQLRDGVTAVEGIDIEKRDQEDDYNFRKTWKKVKSKALCYAAILAGVFITLILLTLVTMAARYVYLIWSDKQAMQDLILNLLLIAFGASVTFFFEHIIKKSK